MSTLQAAVIAPFDAAGDRVRDAAVRALSESGVEIYHFDAQINPGASWVNAIIDAIEASDFLVFELTRHNPNVYYELGVAHALRKPTVLLVSKNATNPPPSDLQGHRYIVYDPDDLSSLADNLARVAKRYVNRGAQKG